MICTYNEYRQTQQTTIRLLKEQLSYYDHPVTDMHFEPGFLKAFYWDNVTVPENYVLSCYENLLNFWIQARLATLRSNHEMYNETQAYENWLKNGRSPLDRIGEFLGDLLKNWETTLIVAAGIGIIYLIKK